MDTFAAPQWVFATREDRLPELLGHAWMPAGQPELPPTAALFGLSTRSRLGMGQAAGAVSPTEVCGRVPTHVSQG